MLRCVDNSPQLLVRKKSSSPQQKLYNSIRSQRTFGEKYSLRGNNAQIRKIGKFQLNKAATYLDYLAAAPSRWNVANNTSLPQILCSQLNIEMKVASLQIIANVWSKECLLGVIRY